MTRLATLLAHDLRLQYRYGIYAAYAFVVTFYILVLVLGGSELPGWVVAAIVFTDPAAIGFFFLGALLMLEKSERVRSALATTPLTAVVYFASKATTLTALAVIACTLLLLFVHGSTNPLLLLVTVALTSIQYVGFGVPAAAFFRTVNGYMIGSTLLLTPLIAPGFLALLDPMPPWLIVVPAVSQFRLMLVALGHSTASIVEIWAMLGIAGAAAVGAATLAILSLRRELGK